MGQSNLKRERERERERELAWNSSFNVKLDW